MNKNEIAYRVAEKTGLNPMQVKAALHAFYEVVINGVSTGEVLELRGFGTFGTKVRKEKPARNINTNEQVMVPEHRVVSFKPVDEFKKKVKEIKII